MTSNIIHRLQGFSNTVPRQLVQNFTKFQMTQCVARSAAPLQRGLFLELHCASAVRAGPAGLHFDVASRRSVVEKLSVFRRPLSPSLSNRPGTDFGSDTALFPIYFGQTCYVYYFRIINSNRTKPETNRPNE